MKSKKIVIKTVEGKFYADIFQNIMTEKGEYRMAHLSFVESFENQEEAKKVGIDYLVKIGNSIENIEVVIE